MYNCQSYYEVVKIDTTKQDSSIVSEEEIILDENGNPIEKVPNAVENKQTPTPEPKPEKKRKTTEEVTLDNL